MENIPKFYSVKNKLFALYLTGLRGLFEGNRTKKYFRGKAWVFTISTIFGLKWTLHRFKHEFDRLDQPNFIIPKYIYTARFESYCYWELRRLAQKKSTRFSYYMYDDQTDFVLYIDKEGGHTTQKNIFNNEKIEYLNNPIFEKIYRQYFYDRSKEVVKKGNLLVAYNKHIDDQDDLNNYLCYKTVNGLDYLRAFWHLYMTKLGFTNAYRYDHLISRSDTVYEYERVKYALNLPDKLAKNKSTTFLKYAKFLLELIEK